MRLGDLLTQAGLLEAKSLREAMMIAKQQGLPVGRVLIMAQFISEPNLQAAVQAQSLIKDGLAEADLAIEALKRCASDSVSLDQALADLGWTDTSTTLSNKLGELIVEAEILTEDSLKEGLAQADQSGFPLGRVLVSMGLMTEQLLASALNAQILVRDGKISREQAIQGLRSCRDRQISLEESLSEHGLTMPSKESIRLGELLVNAQIIDTDRLMQAVELGLVEEKPIGQVLVNLGCLNNEELDTTLMIQKCVAEGKVTKGASGELLKLMLTEGLDYDEAMKAIQAVQPRQSRALPLYQFLQLSGIITAKDIEEALKLGSKDTELMGRMLLLTNSIDQHVLSCAIELNALMTAGTLKAEQAMLAMGLCQNRQCTVAQAFKSLGWNTEFPGANSPDSVNTQNTIPPSPPTASLNLDDLPPAQPDHVSEAQKILTSDFEAPARAGAATGEHPAFQDHSDSGADYTATTDVPPLTVELTRGGPEDEKQPESDTDSAARKRLSDLMP
ncbi:MAG: hypothetical protein R3C24_04645 [Cyanobacteriota/Melainabacteria group bacterium]